MGKLNRWNFINKRIVRGYIKKDFKKNFENMDFEYEIDEYGVSASTTIFPDSINISVDCVADVDSSYCSSIIGTVIRPEEVSAAIEEFNNNGSCFKAFVSSMKDLVIVHPFYCAYSSIFKWYFSECINHIIDLYDSGKLDCLLKVVK